MLFQEFLIPTRKKKIGDSEIKERFPKARDEPKKNQSSRLQVLGSKLIVLKS